MLRELLAALDEADFVSMALVSEESAHGHSCQESHNRIHRVIDPNFDLGEDLLEKYESPKSPLND
jgi:hypothetical protein